MVFIFVLGFQSCCNYEIMFCSHGAIDYSSWGQSWRKEKKTIYWYHGKWRRAQQVILWVLPSPGRYHQHCCISLLAIYTRLWEELIYQLSWAFFCNQDGSKGIRHELSSNIWRPRLSAFVPYAGLTLSQWSFVWSPILIKWWVGREQCNGLQDWEEKQLDIMSIGYKKGGRALHEENENVTNSSIRWRKSPAKQKANASPGNFKQ